MQVGFYCNSCIVALKGRDSETSVCPGPSIKDDYYLRQTSAEVSTAINCSHVELRFIISGRSRSGESLLSSGGSLSDPVGTHVTSTSPIHCPSDNHHTTCRVTKSVALMGLGGGPSCGVPFWPFQSEGHVHPRGEVEVLQTPGPVS